MSILGDAIRNNADLHRALYRIVGTLAAAHITGEDIHRPHLDYLCALADAALPHMPAPPPAEGGQTEPAPLVAHKREE